MYVMFYNAKNLTLKLGDTQIDFDRKVDIPEGYTVEDIAEDTALAMMMNNLYSEAYLQKYKWLMPIAAKISKTTDLGIS